MINREAYAAAAWDFARLNEDLTKSRRLSDLDGMYHHDGHFLFFETKCSDRREIRDGDGQMYALKQLAHKPGVTVLYLWSAGGADGGRDPIDEAWIIRPTVAPLRYARTPPDDGWSIVIAMRDRLIAHADLCDHPHSCSWSLRAPMPLENHR